MRIRIKDRILIAMSGLLLLAFGADVLLRAIGVADLRTVINTFLRTAENSLPGLLCRLAAAVLVAFLGVFCVAMLFRRGGSQRGFVQQKTENGEVSISIKAIHELVQKCVDKHDEIRLLSNTLEGRRDSLVIRMRIALAAGTNIPLAVGNLQKQVRQYVTACSGVDVSEVQVQVENTSVKMSPSQYTVPVPDVTEEQAAVEDVQDEQKAPLIQRLFGRRNEEEQDVLPTPVRSEPEETVQEEVRVNLFADTSDDAPEPAAEPQAVPETSETADEAADEDESADEAAEAAAETSEESAEETSEETSEETAEETAEETEAPEADDASPAEKAEAGTAEDAADGLTGDAEAEQDGLSAPEAAGPEEAGEETERRLNADGTPAAETAQEE